MKKFSAFALAVVLTISLCACGRRQNDAPTDNTTVPTATEPAATTPATTEPATTAPTIIPDMPELDTNIPDPTVDSNSTEGGMDSNGGSNGDSTGGSNGDSARGRSRTR